jgi:tartrate dehydrogenase/decarboxylase/D-malate dehydrogenase
VAQIWSGAMMLEQLGEKQAAHAVEKAIFKVLAHSDVRTRDIGGHASTRDVGEVIAAEVSAVAAVR